MQVAKKISNQDFDLQKAWKMCADSGLNKDEIQSALGAIHFIFTSAAKYSVPSNVLGEEIAQLGIPQENAISLSKVYSDNLTSMDLQLNEEYLRSKKYSVNKFESMTWRVDYDLVTKNTLASLKLNFTNQEIPITISCNQLNLLSEELTRAKGIMEKLKARE